nr:SDR family NAD(P)-dependent oxidoreductase [Gordonia sp. HS-NH1]
MLDRFGSIDVWVNNVGVGAVGYFWDIPIEDHARLVDVNLKGLIYGAHAALRVFRSQGGRGTLVNVGSVDSAVPIALQNTYAATKAAVRSLGHSLSEELRMAGDDDIKVGTIMPWAVDTPWWVRPGQHGCLRRHPRTDGRRGLPLTRFDGVGNCHRLGRR